MKVEPLVFIMDFTKEELATEEWRDVAGYEGLYRVSNLGRIYSVRRNKFMSFYDHHGYKRLKIDKQGKEKDFALHRLVAFAFLPNPDNLPFINHKDENKENNRVSNLEWCTAKYNSNYSISKPIAQYTKKGELVAVYLSAREASRWTGIDDSSIGCVVCGLRTKSAGGFLWKFIDKGQYVDVNNMAYFTGLPYKRLFKDCRRPVRQYTKEGLFIREYRSAVDAAKANPNTSQGSISSVCNKAYKTAGGYVWCYSHDTERIKEIENLQKHDNRNPTSTAEAVT